VIEEGCVGLFDLGGIVHSQTSGKVWSGGHAADQAQPTVCR
jgi:hypothetical protein